MDYIFIGLGEEGPTDCALFIAKGGQRKELWIESPEWKALSGYDFLKCNSGRDRRGWYKDKPAIVITKHDHEYLLLNYLFETAK